MDTLLGGLGTEIRETLHSVLGMLELVMEEPLSDGQSQRLERCRVSAEHLMSTASDVLELARTDQPSFTAEAFDLRDAIDEIAAVMQFLAESRSRKLTWSLSPALPSRVSGDRRLLQDMLRRLISAALNDASGAVELSAREGHPGSIVLAVATPAGDSLQPDPIETSIVLRVVRKRLEYFGGRLTALQQNGQSVLRIDLPLSAPAGLAPAGAAYQPQSESSAAVAPLKLLVAEDSDDSFYLLQAYVKNQGHQITRASDGAQAVEMAKSGAFDFIFMDVKMPVMDGYTASRLIREWETAQGRPRLPILLLSADEAARQMRLGAEVGCSGYLAKPATRSQVLAALNYYARPNPAPGALK